LERQPAESAFQVVGLKIVAVVGADDPYALPSPLDRTGVVYKKANAQVLQRVYDFRAVVISKHRYYAVVRANFGEQVAQVAKRGCNGP